MSFSPPPFPAAGATFQYGNIIWQFDGTAGVWNIQNASLVGAQGPVGPPGPQGDPGEQGDPGDPSVGDGQSMIVSGNVITARLGDVGTTGVLGVSNRFNVVNGIAHHLPASNGASGIASFDSAFFSVSGTGHVSLVGSLNSGVTSFNGLTGAVTLTGDGGAIVGVGNNTIRARVATASLTGVASFPTTDFGVANGAVSLTGNVARTNANNVFTGTNRFTNSASKTDIGLSAANARFTNIRGPENTPITILTNGILTPSQASLRFEASAEGGDISYGTIIVSSAISADRTYTLPDKTGTFAMVGDVPQANSVVTSLNGLTGDRTLTGDGGAIIGAGNNTIRARLAETGVTGVASFNPSFFSVNTGAVSLASPYSVIGVTGIGFGTSDAGLTGKINITNGSNITITESNKLITISANVVGNGASITANAQQVLFASGNRGATGSNNFLFDGASATFAGSSFNFANTTTVKGGVFFDAAEYGEFINFGSTNSIEIRGASGNVQRVRINPAARFTIDIPTTGWSDTPSGIAESVVVIMQNESGFSGDFATGILVQDATNNYLGGVTGGIDVFTLMRLKTNTGTLKMGFPIARGMTAPNQTVGTGN